MSYFGNHAQNSHLVGAPIYIADASSPPEVEILQGNDDGNGNGNVRTEKRILWTEEEISD